MLLASITHLQLKQSNKSRKQDSNTDKVHANKMGDKIAKNLIRDVEKKIEKAKPRFSIPIEIVLTFQHIFHSRCNASTVQRITGINERWEAGEREEKK